MNKKIIELLKSREFVSVATAGPECRPYAAPKFILKIENNSIYLVDYIVGRTFRNLELNPWISISFMDNFSLMGYQLNGSVEIMKKGPEHDLLLKDLARREMDLATQRIIDGVTKGKTHEGFEVTMSAKFAIFKVKIEEIVEISSSGFLKTEKICE